MTPAHDIHNYPQRYEAQLRRLNSLPISRRNKELIREFDDFSLIEGISLPRRTKVINTLCLLASNYLHKDFDRATVEDLKGVVLQIEKRSDYSPWTKHDYKVVLKRFYKWLAYGDDYHQKKEYPKKISWVVSNIKARDQPKVQASDLLTEGEVDAMIRAAEHPRDKAFISMLYELGARIGEIGGLSIGSIQKDRWSYLIDLKGKTGKRTPRIVLSSPFLSNWLNVHPRKEERDAPLWVRLGNRNKIEPLNYKSLKDLVGRLGLRAGIKKRVYPHLFRHTRVTHLLMYKQISEAQAKVYFGWVPSSSMLSDYSHLVSNDVNETILAIHGIKTEREAESKLKPKQCPVCKTINSYNANFCQGCSGVIDAKTAIALDEKIRMRDEAFTKLISDKEVLDLLVRKAKERGLVEELLNAF